MSQERDPGGTVERAWSRLDGLEVPDLWPLIRERAGAPRPLYEARRGRRHPLVAAAVAVVLVGAVAVAVVLAAPAPRPEGNRSVTWAVAGSISLPPEFGGSGPLVAPGAASPMLAASGEDVWLGVPHGTRVVEVARVGGTPAIVRTVTVPPMVAMVADGRQLWILTVDGELVVSVAGAPPTRVATLGPLSGGGAHLAAAGGRLWVAGAAAGGLVAVDPANGGAVAVPGMNGASLLVGGGDQVWVVDAAGTGITLVDAPTATVRWSTRVGPVADAVADNAGLWAIDQDAGTVVHFDRGGRTRSVQADAVRGSEIARVTVTGSEVWVGNSQALQAFGPGGELRQTVVIGNAVLETALAGTPSALWVVDGGARSLSVVVPS